MSLLKIEEPQINSEDNNNDNDLPILGIDLGTTNSLVGIVINNETRFFRDLQGRELHKSVIAFDEKGNIKAIGNDAFENKYPHKIFSIKRLMGKGLEDISISREKYDFEFDRRLGNKDELEIEIANRKFRPTEISSYILKYLKSLAIKGLGLNEDLKIKAVITVPAYFDENAKTATKNAAEIAGIEVVRLVNEPTAAALAYGLENSREGIYAVYDLGGGTFDISILKMQKGVFQVLGVSGNNELGGDDFDEIIINEIFSKKTIESFHLNHSRNILKKIAQKIKEDLSIKQNVFLEEYLDNNLKNIELTKNIFSQIDFENLISSKINETIKITQNLLNDLDLEIGNDKNNVCGLILVGGSSKIPLIKKELNKIFDKTKIYTNLNPDCVVAQGAVMQAFNLGGGNRNILLDVIPLSLGIEMIGGIVDKIIYRNTTIPIIKSKEFTTYADNQTGIKFHIVQGEREFAKDCRSLAQFEIKNIQPLRAGMIKFLVTFKIDADGLLTVSAIDKNSNQKKEIVVKPSFGLDEAQIKNILIDSLKNAKEDIGERITAQNISEAQQNINFLKRDLLEFNDLIANSEREEILLNIAKLERAILSKDNSEISLMIQNLENASQNFILQKMNKSLEKYVNKNIDNI